MKFLSNKKNLYFTGLYLSLFAFMICSATDWGIGIALFKILAILLFGLFLFKGNNANEKDTVQTVDFEKSVMVSVVLLFNIFMLHHGKMSGYYEVFNIACAYVLIIMGIVYFVFYQDRINVREWFSKNKLILLMIGCFVLLSVEVIDAWFLWDAEQYYKSLFSVVENFDADLSGIYGLRLCGHVSQGYSLWLILFQFIKEGTASVQIADIVLAGISIYAYYQILRKLLGEKYSDKTLTLATIPYAFSPFVLGLVGNMSLDSAAMYFLIIFIACSLYHLECLELIFAFCFCFTKEPCVIFYVVYIVAKVICEYFSENQFHLWKLMKFGFGNIKNYIYAMPAILWIILSKLIKQSGWAKTEATQWKSTGYNCFGISDNVISMKLKQTFLLNFNWIFWAIIGLGIAILLIQKIKNKININKNILKMTLPISAVCIMVIIFGCIYVTWTHPRYIVPMIPLMYLMAAVILMNLNKREFYFCVWNLVLAVLLFIQCFTTIDPITKNVFREIPVGTESLYSMQLEPNERISDKTDFCDSIVYNRQYSYWQEILVDVLNQADYNGNMVMVMPNDYNCKKLLGTENSVLWDTKKGCLEYYRRPIPNDCVRISYCNTTQAESVYEAENGKSILYIIPAWTGIDENIISDNERYSKEIIKQGEINNKGYTVKYMVIDMKYKASLDNGNYTVTPKQENSLGLGTDGQWLWLKDGGDELGISAEKTGYQFMFNDYSVAMDVQYGEVNESGTVWVYEPNGTNAQRWKLEKKVDDYYMICWGDYALTYDLDDNSVKLTPKTGDDNQLWSFN